MKNTFKKMLAILLTISMIVVISACGSSGKKVANSTTDIEISYWNAGLGSKWLEDVVEAFNKSQSKYHATFHASANHNSAAATYGMDTSTQAANSISSRAL